MENEKRSCPDGGQPQPKKPRIEDQSTSRETQVEYTVRVKNRRSVRKYGAESVTYEVKLNSGIDGDLLSNILNSLEAVFSRVLDDTCGDLGDEDRVRICIFSSALDKPISARLVLRRTLTFQMVLSAIVKVLQSKKSIPVDESFPEILTVKTVRASGHTKILNVMSGRLTKKNVIRITNDDSLCCARALVVAAAVIRKDPQVNTIKDSRKAKQRNLAKDLHERAGVPLGECGLEELKKSEEVLGVQAYVVSAEHLNKLIYRGVEKTEKVFMYYHDKHFDVITSMSGFLGVSYYCIPCEKGYKNKERHHCAIVCAVCHNDLCMHTINKFCTECFQMCRSEECFVRHKTQHRGHKSLCERLFHCRKFGKNVERVNRRADQHVCGESKCRSCKKYVQLPEHLCFVQSVPPKKSTTKYLFFDFECTQETNEHKVNLCVAQTFEGEEFVFRGPNACDEFCRFLFNDDKRGVTAISHNAKGYNAIFVLNYLLRHGVKPSVIFRGCKIMSLTVESHGIRLIDSLNFVPMSLAKLPAASNLKELKKGYFPHYFNAEANQTYKGPLPEQKFYAREQMTPAGKEQFLVWYEECSKSMNFEFC